MNSYEFEIFGKIKGKARARTYFNRYMNKIITYTPADTVSYENWVKDSFINTYPIYTIIENAVKVKIECLFYKGKSKLLYPTKKPDTDNIAKIILDSLNNIAYKDDKQVIELIVEKKWAKYESVKVYIEEV